MAAVAFTISSRGTSEQEAHDKLIPLLDGLKSACSSAELELTGQYLLSGRNAYVIQWGERDYQGRANLQIEKRAGITYNQIYKLVNDIQPNPFRIIRK